MHDRNLQLPPDDPRLTAYALGELEGDDRAAVEAAIRDDPAARAAVDEIRATTAKLSAALAAEPMLPAQPHTALAAIIPGKDPRKLDGGPLQPWNVIRLPQFHYLVVGLAAAGLALVVILREPPPTPAEKTSRVAPVSPPVAPVAVRATAEAPEAVAPATAAPAAEVAVAPAEITTQAIAPAAPTPTLNPDRLSLLAQAKSVEDLLNKVGPLARGPQVAPVASSPRVAAILTAPKAGAMAVQPVGADQDAKSRTYTHPQDEKFVKNAEPSVAAAAGSVITAVPRAPVVVVPNANPNLLNPSTGSILDRSTGTYTQSSQPGGTANPDGSRTFAAGRPPPAAGREPTLMPPPPLPPSSALLESAREALLRPLPSAQFGSHPEGAAAGRDNNFVIVAQTPVSAFSIDAENSSWPAIRRWLQAKRLPPRETVRIEELVNYFPYHYPSPRGDAPFAASLEVADAPWAPDHRLVRIGLKAREVQTVPRPPLNLVFVLDVVDVERLSSRLPMIKEAIQSLIGKLRPEDRVALVSCRDQASLVLSPTLAARAREIAGALESMEAGGATNRMKGIQLAYDVVQSSAAPGSNSRVILCTDGNAGITITAEGALARFLEGKTRSGVTLTAFGFGMGIYRDSLIDFLADYGSGNYGYIDSRRDAEKMLAEDVNGPAVTIAKDVKIEVEFNPARVASYRLIGYENRELGHKDFKSGTLAADEISAGHAVTALFEIVPADSGTRVAPATAEGLRYQPQKIAAINLPDQNELLTVKVRYKKPGGAISRKLDLPVADARTRFVDASADFKFAAAVAGFGMVLRDSPYKGSTTLASVVEWAEAGTGDDPGGYRGEFLELAREADRQVR